MAIFHDTQAPARCGRLPLDHGYALKYEQSGRPDGFPVLYMHGGHDAGMGPAMRRFHDPAAYRLVMFDQRGAGASCPACDVRHNTTQLLIEDNLSSARPAHAGSRGNPPPAGPHRPRPVRLVLCTVVRGAVTPGTARIPPPAAAKHRALSERARHCRRAASHDGRAEIDGPVIDRAGRDQPTR